MFFRLCAWNQIGNRKNKIAGVEISVSEEDNMVRQAEILTACQSNGTGPSSELIQHEDIDSFMFGGRTL